MTNTISSKVISALAALFFYFHHSAEHNQKSNQTVEAVNHT